MSATDYSGQFGDSVLTDCATMSGKNWYLYIETPGGEVSLAYSSTHNTTINPSTLSISNVLGDASSTCFYPSFEARLEVDPSLVYNGVYMPYSGGWVYRTASGRTLARDVVAPSANVTTKAAATALADAMLASSEDEAERVTCVIKVPAASLGDIRAGMTITAKFTHFPNWSAGVDSFILSETIAQDEENQDFYNVTLVLGHAVPVSFATGGAPDNTRVWPSQQPPFVPSGASDYPTMVAADGALHAWKFDTADASGTTVTDYIGSDDGFDTKTGSNPTTAGGPASISSGANNWHLQRTDSNGTSVTTSISDGLDWPAGNSDWTVEYWGDYITTFLDAAFYTSWGLQFSAYIRIFVGGSPTSLDIASAGVSSISTDSGSLDVSAYTGAGWHHFALTYIGSTRGYVFYVDGVNRWTGTGSADNIMVCPSGSGQTQILNYTALQDYRHGWQAIYPLALSATQVANHALGDAGASGTSTTAPATGQPIAPEVAGTGDGSTTTFTTNYPYVPGSLHVTVGGVPQTVTETDPTTGSFTLATAPPTGAQVLVTYNAASQTPTGATNMPPTAGTTTIPATVKLLTNKSGGSVAAGDVVIVDTGNNDAFTTTTTAQETKPVGIAQATIADNAAGPVLLQGYAPLVNVTASVTRGNYAQTSTTVKEATENSSRQSGSFAIFLTGGATPDAYLFGVPDSSSGGGGSLSVTDGSTTVSSVTSIDFTAGATVSSGGAGIADVSITGGGASPLTTKGDIWGYSTTDDRIPVGTDTYVLTADSGASLGVSWQAGGGGGGSSRYPLDSYTLDGTYGDDFTGSGLSGIWTPRGFSGGDETFQLGKDATYMRLTTAGRSAGDGFLQTAPGGDWTFAMSMVVREVNSCAFGPVVVDSSGNGLGVLLYTSPQTLILINISTYSSYPGGFNNRGSTVAPNYDTKVWMYLRKSGGDFYAASSFDGEIYSEETGVMTPGITVDRVGFLLAPIGGFPPVIDVDQFNKIA